MINHFIRSAIRFSGLGNLPVTVRTGINAGARWTCFPWTSYWLGTHEPEVQNWFNTLPDLTGKCCWDLGAHYGFYSIAFATRVGPTGQVIGFEPNAQTFSKLSRHKSLNRLEQLTIFNAGVSNESGSLELLRYDDADTTSTHFAFSGETVENVPFKEIVRVHALDDLVNSGQIQLPSVVKIDVEGHGHRALDGAKLSLEKARPIILMGLHCEEEKNAVEQQLLPLGYTAMDLCGVPLKDLPVFGDVVLQPGATT